MRDQLKNAAPAWSKRKEVDDGLLGRAVDERENKSQRQVGRGELIAQVICVCFLLR